MNDAIGQGGAKLGRFRRACTLALMFATIGSLAAEGRFVVAAECVVATVNPLATDAGLEAFAKGGNAIDAAVAAALTLGVVDNHNSGIGGGCFILIRTAEDEVAAIDGRETAPAAATRNMFLRNGTAVPQLSQTGPLAVGVPGALAAYAIAVDDYGRRSLADLLVPAAQIAESGFAIDSVYAARLSATAKKLALFEGSRRALLDANGEPFREGDLLRQPD
ncbi:MAG: gamma-glutamyltransferase, partial [Planctomycetota bacterium]